jgi:hypothetical protein
MTGPALLADFPRNQIFQVASSNGPFGSDEPTSRDPESKKPVTLKESTTIVDRFFNVVHSTFQRKQQKSYVWNLQGGVDHLRHGSK